MSDDKNKIKTNFDRVSDVFTNNTNPLSPKGNEKEFLTASSREEIEKEKKTFQQQQYIYNQYNEVNKYDEQKVLQASGLRIPAALEYNLMEGYPILAGALNLFSEEACTVGENGKMLNIYSDNKKIKKELENLFYNVLMINTNLPYWTRIMCKYGDNFIYLLTESGENAKGIKGVKVLPVLEIERTETIDQYNNLKTVFTHQYAKQTFGSWQVCHFRMLGDDRLMPYGTSIFAPIRTYFKMLRMCEDGMLVYRATRMAERRIFKIMVGNADPADVGQIVQQAAMRAKRTDLIDQSTGGLNYKFNPATVDQDIFVPVREPGEASPIETLGGANNLSEIGDVLYFRENLFAGLSTPASFLGFSGDGGGSVGGGRNLSQLDVRFARRINRVQQSTLSELNKMAIVHLMLLGYEDDVLSSFKLTLTNPSTQAEMLKIEMWKEKVALYRDLTTPNETGIKAMSETEAKAQVFGMSKDEIKLDIEKQFLENIIGNEIKDASLTLKRSGLFDEMISYYRLLTSQNPSFNPSGEGSDDSSGSGGGSGGSFSGGNTENDIETAPTDTELNGEEGSQVNEPGTESTDETNAVPPAPAGEAPVDLFGDNQAEPETSTKQAERFIKKGKLMNENLIKELRKLGIKE